MAKTTAVRKTKGNLKVSPLKRYKKQVKRMKNRLKDEVISAEKLAIYEARLNVAEEKLRGAK